MPSDFDIDNVKPQIPYPAWANEYLTPTIPAPWDEEEEPDSEA